ncbi:MAG: hypothetical protein H6814_11660 [Phycisphaeraceae bacterium]|nr:hypothetical protein [Phycisphaeraceae bacterium]
MPVLLPKFAAGALKSFLAMPRAEQAFTLVAGTAVTGAGIALGPMMLMADDGVEAAPQSQVIVESGIPQDPGRRAVVDGMVQLFASCRAIIGEHDSEGSRDAGSITLWQQDLQDPGVVNLTEILSVGHNKLLETLLVFTAPDGPPDAPAPSWLLYSDDPITSWRETPGVSASVIATGVTDLWVSRSPEPGGSATVRLGLTWAGGMSEDREETVLAITLPSFQGR